MYSKLNDIEYLRNLVEAGKSLRTIRVAIGCGPVFTLRKLQEFGLVDPDLTVADCKVEGFGTKMAKVREAFTYEDYLKRIVEEKTTVKALSKELDLNYYRLHYIVYEEYRKKYKESETSTAL